MPACTAPCSDQQCPLLLAAAFAEWRFIRTAAGLLESTCGGLAHCIACISEPDSLTEPQAVPTSAEVAPQPSRLTVLPLALVSLQLLAASAIRIAAARLCSNLLLKEGSFSPAFSS